MDSISQRSVLLVDDERILLLDLQRTLQRLGHSTIAVAASGAEALRVANTLPPEIVIMDPRLCGGLDGIETVEHLRARHGNFGLIYLTSGVDEEQRARAERTFPNAWLAKPYNHEHLERALEAAGVRSRASQHSARSGDSGHGSSRVTSEP